jgi:hypothetical protein
MHLKENIVEHFDYEAITPDVWKHIYSWYSADWSILRYVCKDRVNRYAVFLDLYPERKQLSLDLDAETFDDSESDQMLQVSVPDLLDHLKEN